MPCRGNPMTSTSSLWGRLDRAFRPVENLAAQVAAILLVAAMLLVSADALMRYAFHAPLKFQYTLTESYLMIAIVCLPMAWGFRTGGYIRIEALLSRLPSAGRSLLIRMGLVVSAVYVGALGWAAFKHFWSAWLSDEVMFGVIDWPVAWSWFWIPLGILLLTIRLLLIAVGPDSQLQADPHAGEGAE